MKLQVLAAAVNNEAKTLAESMNLQTLAVIVNQSDRYDYEEFAYNDDYISLPSQFEIHSYEIMEKYIET